MTILGKSAYGQEPMKKNAETNHERFIRKQRDSDGGQENYSVWRSS